MARGNAASVLLRCLLDFDPLPAQITYRQRRCRAILEGVHTLQALAADSPAAAFRPATHSGPWSMPLRQTVAAPV